MQKNEITEHHIYSGLAARIGEEHNRKILLRIAADEKRHYETWKKVTGREMAPSQGRIFLYIMIARFLGLAFGLKLMERGEGAARETYAGLQKAYPRISGRVMLDEQKHEKALIDLLNDKRLSYASSIVLGLNDALVELTGTLAGLTLAINNRVIIGMTGLILGFAASLSMASSEYLSKKEENDQTTPPLAAALYTGMAYFITVLVLTAPYFFVLNVYTAFATMMGLAIVIILIYTYYISIARSVSFWSRFVEMAAISLGVATVSFGFGWLIKKVLGVDV